MEQGVLEARPQPLIGILTAATAVVLGGTFTSTSLLVADYSITMAMDFMGHVRELTVSS